MIATSALARSDARSTGARRGSARMRSISPDWRTTVQVADGGFGLGIARKLVPVIDLSVGVGAFYDVRDSRVIPMVYGSLFRW